MIDFKCPKCHETMSVPETLAGRSETCPSCGNVAIVPQPTPPVVQPAATAPQRTPRSPSTSVQPKAEIPAFHENQQKMRKCKWCAKDVPEESLRCSFCGKWRMDIWKDKMAYYGFEVFSLVPIIFLFVGMRMGWWHEPYSIFFKRFSLEKFFGSASGLLILLGFVIFSGLAIYYFLKVSRKMGGSGAALRPTKGKNE